MLRNTEMTWPPAWREWLFDELSVTRRCEDLQEDCMSRQVLRAQAARWQDRTFTENSTSARASACAKKDGRTIPKRSWVASVSGIYLKGTLTHALNFLQ